MSGDNPSYLETSFDFIENMDEATNADDIVDIFGRTISGFGFTNLIISDLPPPYEGIEDTIYFDKLPEGWLELYATQKYARFDPVARMCRNTFRPFDWKEAPYDREWEADAGELMALAQDFGMVRGFCVPVPGFAQRTACISMSGQHFDLPVRAKPLLQFISLYTAEKIRQVVRADQQPARSPLTMRESEVLQWAAVGKTAHDVAEIMNITERTVTAHTVSAMNKLGAANKTQAVVRAMQRRLIPLDL